MSYAVTLQIRGPAVVLLELLTVQASSIRRRPKELSHFAALTSVSESSTVYSTMVPNNTVATWVSALRISSDLFTVLIKWLGKHFRSPPSQPLERVGCVSRRVNRASRNAGTYVV